MSHKINSNDLRGYEFKQEIAGSYGKGEHKTLNVRILTGDVATVWYEVLENRVLIGFRSKLSDAVVLYNEL